MFIEEKLCKILEDLSEGDLENRSLQRVITISYAVEKQGTTTSLSSEKELKERRPIITLYLGDKYAKFHDEFTQTAYSNSKLRPLVYYLEKNSWEMNLD